MGGWYKLTDVKMGGWLDGADGGWMGGWKERCLDR